MERQTSPSRRSYRGATAEARRAERRARLLDAALEGFGTQGFHATSVRSLCQGAGLTERYFYESFEHSEALLATLYQQIIDRLEADTLVALQTAGPDPESMARAALEVYFSHNEDPRIARITLFEILGISPSIDALYRDAMDRFALLIVNLVGPQVPAAHRRQLHLDLIATGLVGAVVQIIMRWVLSRYQTPRKTVIDSAMLLFSAVIAQLGVPRASN